MIPGFGPILDDVERSDDNGGGTVESQVDRQEARLDANTWGSHGQHLPVKLLGRNLDYARRHDQQAHRSTTRRPLVAPHFLYLAITTHLHTVINVDGPV